MIKDYANDYNNITVTILKVSAEFQDNIGLNAGDQMVIYIDNTKKVIDNKMNDFYNTKTKRYYKDSDKILDISNHEEHKFSHFFITFE